MSKKQIRWEASAVSVCIALFILYWKSGFFIRLPRVETHRPSEKSRIKNATVSWAFLELKLSMTGPSSTLPSFRFMAGNEEGGSLYTGYNFTGDNDAAVPFEVKTSCPEDVFTHASPDLRVSQLPWRIQDDWGCEQKPTNVSVLILENEYLKATITPQWGGKIWSLYNKKHKRDMFFNNPAHQPSNIGYRKAWTSGGCEWNWSPGKIGHSAFSESPVWTAVLENVTTYGPVVRVYEFDRQNATVWQVDILLHGETLWVHPKLTNPNERTVPGYWWTCVAMGVDGPTNRILSPAALSIDGNGQCTPWPWGSFNLENTSFRGPNVDGCSQDDTCAWQNDLSFVGNIPFANDFFFYIEKEQMPWISQVQEDGFTVLHSHPSFLNGTKFFTWGWHERGIFNQDFLSATNTEQYCNNNTSAYDPSCMNDHPGLYTELQIGPGRTQMHTFPFPANSVLEWTEWFKAWMADETEMKHRDYSVPLAAVETWINGPDGMSSDMLKEIDSILQDIGDLMPEPEQIVYEGMPWGGLQEKLLQQIQPSKLSMAVPLAPGCLFPKPKATAETKPWLELLEMGTFSRATLASIPVNFEVSDAWINLLQASIDQGNETWLHFLFLGTHSLETTNPKGARSCFHKSMSLKPSVHAARNLATIAPTKEEVIKWYETAWRIWTEMDPGDDPQIMLQLGGDLSGEICGWLLGNERWRELEIFVQQLGSRSSSSVFLKKDRALHAQAALAVHSGNFRKALLILRGNCFPTYGSLRSDLLALWWTANKQKASADRGGASLSTSELLSLRKHLRCDGDYSQRNIDDPCLCGPPNLGYKYGG